MSDSARRASAVVAMPIVALLTLLAWVFASPIGAGPDDDYHLVSSWCAGPTADETCLPPEPGFAYHRAPEALVEIACFAFDAEQSAACQGEEWSWSSDDLVETGRLNSIGAYPPVYYAVTGSVTGHDLHASALLMRGLSAVLFLLLLVGLFIALPAHRRPALAWVFLLTAVPLGLFLVGTNNPSLWSWIGVGAAPVALMGFYESAGRRKAALGALFVVSAVAAAGSRSDAAIYVCIAMGAVGIVAFTHTRRFYLDSILPLITALVSVAIFVSAFAARHGLGGYAGQILDADTGAPLEPPPSAEGPAVGPVLPETDDGGTPLTGFGLLASNILNVPRLWTGVFGDRWGLGWLDTSMPAFVPAATVAAFVLVGALGVARPTLRRAVAVALVFLALVVIPVVILQTGGFAVGEQVQPRYLLPLVALLVAVVTLVSADRPLVLTRVQRLLVIVALSAAHFVALHMNIRRYVTGIDESGPNLDAGVEWWWAGPIGPNAVWLLGSLAFGLLVWLVVSVYSKPVLSDSAAIVAAPAPVR